MARARAPQDDVEARRFRANIGRRLFDSPLTPIKIGRYVVLGTAGVGGLGVVYSAYDPELDRKVALKLLRPHAAKGSTRTDARTRLVREAQAMARLAHPNVIAVYDVGDVDEQVYIAMELVEGEDLDDWIQQNDPDWASIRDTFVAAGRGLSAAHSAGLVHRDFKPSNVLVGADGRVRVLDFGLARVAADDDPPEPKPLESDSGSSAFEEDLTITGTVLGTPAYMPPEQHDGKPVDARGDQYSFCVALFEGLYQRRPFSGKNVDAIALSKAKMKLDSVPDGKVPTWLRTVVVRGLSASPDARYPSMDALLVALERDPRRTRRRALGAGLAVAAVLGLGFGVWSLGRAHAQSCEGVERELDGIWDGPSSSRVRSAFEASDKAYAVETWERVEKAIDEYADTWLAHRRRACEERDSEPTASALERRMCLDRRLKELAELVNLLGRGDPDVIENAVDAVASLRPTQACEEVDGTPLVSAELRARIDSIETRLSLGRALLEAGKYDEAIALSNEVETNARSIDYVSGQIHARILRGSAHDEVGASEDAQTTLLDALAFAERHGDNESAADALIELTYVIGVSAARHAEGRRWAKLAEAKLSRVRDAESREAKLRGSLGVVLNEQGEPELARQAHQRALELHTKLFGEDHLTVASSLNNLGNVFMSEGNYAKAADHFEQALDGYERVFGSHHPRVARPLGNYATALIKLGRADEAEPQLERTLSIIEEAYGHEHPMVANTLNNLGTAIKQQGKLAQALAHFRDAVAVGEKVLGPDAPSVIGIHTNIGDTQRLLGNLEAALQHQQIALTGLRNTLGEDHPRLAYVLNNIAGVYAELGRHDEAADAYARAVRLWERAYGPEHPSAIESLRRLGEEHLVLGRRERAIEELERALALANRGDPEPASVARGRFALARALWSDAGQRERALGLALSARETLTGESGAAIDAWLATHR